MSVEPGILDANVLAYAVNADAPQHAVSRALLDAAHSESTRLYAPASPRDWWKLANGVKRIYTFNTADFEVFPELAVVTP